MVLDVIRGYMQVANGLSDVAVARARELAEQLTSQSVEVTSKSQEQVQVLTDELLETSRTNRDLLTGLIRTEVDRTVGRMGFVREEELAAVRKHVQRLESQLRKEQQKATDRATGAVMTAAGASQSAAKTAVNAASAVSGVAAQAMGRSSSVDKAKSEIKEWQADDTPIEPKATPAARTPAKKAPSKKAPARKSAAKKAPARKTTAKKAPARKTTAKKAPAKKTTAKKAPARKTATAKKSSR